MAICRGSNSQGLRASIRRYEYVQISRPRGPEQRWSFMNTYRPKKSTLRVQPLWSGVDEVEVEGLHQYSCIDLDFFQLVYEYD